jgi:hypothetical protein
MSYNISRLARAPFSEDPLLQYVSSEALESGGD